jgi:hypothetical protein
MFYSADALNAALNVDIYSSWGLGENTMSEILGLNLSQFVSNHQIPNDEPIAADTLNDTNCPVCNKSLNVSNQTFLDLITGKEPEHNSHNCTKSFRRHCNREHPKVQLWLGAELSYSFDSSVSMLYLAQKVIARASHDNPVTSVHVEEVMEHGTSMAIKNKLAVIFGHSFYYLHVHRISKMQFGYNEEERSWFFDGVFNLLQKLLESVTGFEWNDFLRLETDDFLRLNFVKVFLRQGLFFNPPFAAFIGVDVPKYLHLKIDYHKRGDDVMAKHSIKLGYEYLWKPNKDHIHTGGSTYGEITKAGVSELVQGIEKKFLKDLSDRDKQNLRVLDVGGGLMTTMFHMAQVIPGYFAGIEYDPLRVRMFTESYLNLISEHKNDLKNKKLAYLWKDLKDVSMFDFDIVYSFDQAFSFEDYAKLIDVFDASPRVKLFISFKGARGGNNDFAMDLEAKGFELIHTVPLKMKESMEACTAGFFLKQEVFNHAGDNTETGTLAEEWNPCSKFWNTDNLLIEALNELKDEVNDGLEAEKKTRMNRKRNCEDI